MLNFALLHWFNFNVCHFQDISGCNTSPVEGADSGDSTLAYLCSALSRDDGVFVFPSLASGEYTVVSYRRKSQQKTAVIFFFVCQKYNRRPNDVYVHSAATLI